MISVMRRMILLLLYIDMWLQGVGLKTVEYIIVGPFCIFSPGSAFEVENLRVSGGCEGTVSFLPM